MYIVPHSIIATLINFFVEFCGNCSIHGFRYITERKLHFSERLWWMFCVGVSFLLCGLSIQSIWVIWHESPVTITFTEKDTPISEIPFPQVTICPLAKALKKKVETPSALFFHRPVDKMKIDALAHLCFDKSIHTNESLDYVKFSDKFLNNSIYKTIEEIALPMDEVIQWSFWQANYNLNWFVPVYTDEGLCFAFNALNSHEMYTEEVAAKLKTVHGNPNISHWSLDHGYESDVNENGYPHRVFSTNPRRSLRCHLSVNTDDQFVCKKGLGYQVFLNVPGEVIHTRSFPINIQFSRREIIRVKPKLITTTENLRNYAPNQRQCFFDSERRLRFLKLYTQNNCEAECLANYTKSVCGCVKFHMPRDEDTKICGAASITCYATAEWNLYGDDIIVGMKDQDARKFRENCNCLPACHHIAYDASFAAGRALGDISDKMVSEVIVLFREPQIITLQRTPLYTLTDFLAACGGLLGLFLGISALSVVEFVYYFTLRLFWTFRQSRDNHFSVNISLQQERIKSISIDIPNY